MNMLPYYHPTTVVFVDDAEPFLDSIHLSMPGDQACLCYTGAREALERLNGAGAGEPLHRRCFSAEGSPWQNPLISIDLGLIEEEINNVERFARVSVVVVDYAMPEMDGLEFCSRVADPGIKKVLLTGVADEKVAVEAFNGGLIDRFIRKHGSADPRSIAEHVSELQREHFRDQLATLTQALALNAPRFLGEPDVTARFCELCHAHRVVEYYLVDDPAGFLMLTASGRLLRFVIYSDDEMAQWADELGRLAAPAGIVEAIASRRKLPVLFERPEHYGREAFPWQECIHPAETIDGQLRWHAAVVSETPRDIDFDVERSCFAAYLERLDQ